MPVYGSVGNTVPTAIYSGDITSVWLAEQPAVGGRSMPAAIASVDGRGTPNLIVEGEFSGAPGAFEIDVYEADTERLSNYKAIPGAVINVVDAVNNSFRLDLGAFYGKFCTLVMKALANNVNVNARLINR